MQNSDYTPAQIALLREQKNLTFDLYVHVGDKFILYVNANDKEKSERIERLYKKGHKNLYVHASHLEEYRSFLRRQIDSAYETAKNLNVNEQAKIILRTQIKIVENLMNAPEDQLVLEVLVDSSRKFMDFTFNTPQALKSILEIKNDDNNSAHHGIRTAIFSVALCHRLKITDPDIITSLMIGAQLHDIEFKFSMLDVYARIKDLEGDEKVRLYKRQPELGYERLKQTELYTQISLDIVSQIEELSDGSGYPENLTEDKINPISLIAGTSNSFDKHLFHSESTMKDALKVFLIEAMGLHPLTHLQALQDILKEKGLI